MADMYVRVSMRTPIPARVPIGKANVAVVGYDAANDAYFLSASGVRIDPANWQGYKIGKLEDFNALYSTTPGNTALYKWMTTYFSELKESADPATVFFYRFGGEAGGTYTDQTAIPAGGVKDWKTVTSPVTAITGVKVHYAHGKGGANETVSQASGYTLETDDTGKYTGKITFKTGYPKNSTPTEQAVNLATDTVLISYTTATLPEALKIFNNQDVQLLCLAYDPGKMSGASSAQGIYGGTSFVDDMKTALAHCTSRTTSGWYRQLCCWLPANAALTDATGKYGGSYSEYFADFKANELGANQNVMVAGEKQTLATSGYFGERDTSAMIAAAVRNTKIRNTLTGYTPQLAVTPEENESILRAYQVAQIMTWSKIQNLRGQLPFLNFGYTFGVGRRKTINNVRCLYQIKHALLAALLQLVLSPDLHYDIGGIRRIKSVIAATITECEQKGLCDGLVSMSIPIEEYLAIPVGKRTVEDQTIVTAAQDSAIVDNIEVTYLWGPNPETIVISALGDI